MGKKRCFWELFCFRLIETEGKGEEDEVNHFFDFPFLQWTIFEMTSSTPQNIKKGNVWHQAIMEESQDTDPFTTRLLSFQQVLKKILKIKGEFLSQTKYWGNPLTAEH